MLAQARYDFDAWIDWTWVEDNSDVIWAAFREHLLLTVLAVLIGFAISLPLALIGVEKRWALPPIISIAGVLYIIPSIALLAFLVPVTGLTRTTALIPLVSYTLLILIRNTVEGFDSVPNHVTEAADGMGFTNMRRRLRVELPIALPAIMAGIRIATVTTIGLVTVTALIGTDNFGQLILGGLNQRVGGFRTEIMVGVLGSVLLALCADLILAGVQWFVTPWSRKRARP
jgi:osmoprotectant transport system permease protein